MKALMLVIVLAHGGFWFGGDNNITVHWAAPEAGTPAAVLSWQLSHGELQLASNDVPLAPGEKATTITLPMPEARALADYTWTYVLKDPQGKVLEKGERIIHLYPARTLADRIQPLKGKTVAVVENRNDGLAATLKDAQLNIVQVQAPAELQLRRPDVVLVGENELPENELGQDVLLNLAKQGTSVMVFSQNRPEKLFGFPLRKRRLPAAPEELTWRQKHGLFEGLNATALDAWTRESGPELNALALPPNAAVLELAWWTRETPGLVPVPIDALAATQTIGDGRIVYWQIPVGDWKHDPRAHMLLANTLDYALVRPEPTLPQSLREKIQTEKPAKDKNTLGAKS